MHGSWFFIIQRMHTCMQIRMLSYTYRLLSHQTSYRPGIYAFQLSTWKYAENIMVAPLELRECYVTKVLCPHVIIVSYVLRASFIQSAQGSQPTAALADQQCHVPIMHVAAIIVNIGVIWNLHKT